MNYITKPLKSRSSTSEHYSIKLKVNTPAKIQRKYYLATDVRVLELTHTYGVILNMIPFFDKQAARVKVLYGNTRERMVSDYIFLLTHYAARGKYV